MADRKASVALELKAGQFKTELTIVEKGVKGLDDKVEKLDKDITKITPDAAKAAAAMKLLGGSVDDAGRKIATIGDKATALQILDQRIRTSRNEVRRLAAEFEKTGDAGLFRRLGTASGELNSLTGIRKKLAAELVAGAAEAGTESGKTFAQLFQGGITGIWQALPAEAKAGIGATAAVIVLAISAAVFEGVATGLALGVTGGALATGIVMALHDVRVANAFTTLGTHIQDGLHKAVAPIKPELIAAAAILEHSFEAIGPRARAVFASLAGYIRPLATGIGKGIEAAMPGIQHLVESAGPLLQALADSLPMLGRSFGSLFDTIAEHSQGITYFFKFLMANVATLIKFLEIAVDWAGAIFDTFSKLTNAGNRLFHGDSTPAAHAYAGSLTDVGTAADGTKVIIGDLTNEVANQAGAAWDGVNANDALKDSFNRLFNETMNLEQANLAVKQGWADLKKELQDGKRTLDTNTQAGRDNVQSIFQQIDALNQQREAALAASDGTYASTQRINAAYQSQIAALRDLLIQLGFDRAAVDAFIAKWMQAAGLSDITRTITTRYVIQYFTEHYGSMADARESFRGNAHGSIRKAAVGMLIPPSNPGTILTAEPQTGGEALIPLQGISQTRAMNLMRTVGAGYGLDVTPRWQSGGNWTGPRSSASGGGSTVDHRALGIAVRDALSGMRVVLDGQRVGYVQGRQGDLLRRGG